MNAEEFVDIFSKVVIETTINSTRKLLESPPGRRPEKKLPRYQIGINL